jgi:hypothetical protein
MQVVVEDPLALLLFLMAALAVVETQMQQTYLELQLVQMAQQI